MNIGAAAGRSGVRPEQFRSEGEGRSAEILGTMEKELRQIRSAAHRRVQEIRGKADAEATRVYGAAPRQLARGLQRFAATLERLCTLPNIRAALCLA